MKNLRRLFFIFKWRSRLKNNSGLHPYKKYDLFSKELKKLPVPTAKRIKKNWKMEYWFQKYFRGDFLKTWFYTFGRTRGAWRSLTLGGEERWRLNTLWGVWGSSTGKFWKCKIFEIQFEAILCSRCLLIFREFSIIPIRSLRERQRLNRFCRLPSQSASAGFPRLFQVHKYK